MAGGSSSDEEEEGKEEPKVEEIKEEPKKTMEENTKDVLDALSGKGAKSIDLCALDEGDKGESKCEEGDRLLLKGFTRANVRFHLLSGDLKALKTK